METDRGMSNEYRARLADELRAAERAAAAPYISYPPSPWWYMPVVGAWLAAFIAVFARWSEGSDVLVGAGLVVLIVLEIVFVRWMYTRHGAMPWPGMGTPPPEIGRLWRWYFIAALAVVAVVAAVWWQIGVAAASATAFVLVTAGLVWYEKAYAKASAAVKSRLS